jgi:hypothetical protein
VHVAHAAGNARGRRLRGARAAAFVALAKVAPTCDKRTPARQSFSTDDGGPHRREGRRQGQPDVVARWGSRADDPRQRERRGPTASSFGVLGRKTDGVRAAAAGRRTAARQRGGRRLSDLTSRDDGFVQRQCAWTATVAHSDRGVVLRHGGEAGEASDRAVG